MYPRLKIEWVLGAALKNPNYLLSRLQGGYKRSLIDIVKDSKREAQRMLSGPGFIVTRGARRGQLTSRRTPQGSPAGAYPVPRRTGFLKSRVDIVEPGKSKIWGVSSDLRTRKKTTAGTLSAGALEAVLYDNAAYASVIHEGGRFSPYGRRPYLEHGVARAMTRLDVHLRKNIQPILNRIFG